VRPTPGDVVDARVRSGEDRERAYDEQESDDDVDEHASIVLDVFNQNQSR
jgi:hypothetical protein